MAKQKIKIGSVQKTKDGRKTFVVSRFDLQNLKKFMDSKEAKDLLVSTDPKAKKYFNMESKQDQIASLNKAVSEGKLTEDVGASKLEKLNKIPDYVLVDVSTLIEGNDF